MEQWEGLGPFGLHFHEDPEFQTADEKSVSNDSSSLSTFICNQKLFMTLIHETSTLKPRSHVKNNSETSTNLLGRLEFKILCKYASP